MDPNACLLALLEAIVDDDRDQAIESLDNLREWLEKGGAMPSPIAYRLITDPSLYRN